ncbi:hypothetical protein I4U23_023170 [Adineta vaga]|nr:hypothetical protein I4U23_023170 [Adineta vaga]
MDKTEESSEYKGPDLTTNSVSRSTTTNKAWQTRITQERRNHLVQKCVTALTSSTDQQTGNDRYAILAMNFTKHIEHEAFEIANDQEEYFHKIAEKIYLFQKEMENRKLKQR